MKISCSECRQQLGELIDGEATGPIEATADARGHVVACAECERDLALLRAARDELRSFPVVAVPPDLRERVRAQISAAPSTPLVAVPLHLQRTKTNKLVSQKDFLKPERKTFRSRTDELIGFLQRPSNLVWSGGLTIGLFCIVLLVRPDRPKMIALPPAAMTSQSRESYGDEVEESNSTASAKSIPAKPGAQAKTNAPKPSTPRQPPTPFFGLPSGGSNGTELLPGKALGNGQTPPSPAAPRPNKKFVAPDTTEKLRTNGEAASSIASGNAATKPPNTQIAELPAPAREDGVAAIARDKSRNNSPAATLPETSRRETRSGQREGNFDAGASTMMAEAPSPAMAKSPASAATTRDSDNRNGSRNSNDQARAAKSDRAPSENNAPVSRQVVARITAPRDINWGQISVVLPEGVRFEGGGKARVLWRGAVGAGEKIEVPFNVQAASGSHSIRLSLQEVVKGEAQTLARDSVSVSGR